MRKLMCTLLIIVVIFPMLLFLNPFAWGMRKVPSYTPTEKMEEELNILEKELNTSEKTEASLFTVNRDVGNIWYVRDYKNQALDSLGNFGIELWEIKNVEQAKKIIKKHVPLIVKELGCNCYDSIFFYYKTIKLKQNQVKFTKEELIKMEEARVNGFDNDSEKLEEKIKWFGYKINQHGR
jgi:hypothetical protein